MDLVVPNTLNISLWIYFILCDIVFSNFKKIFKTLNLKIWKLNTEPKLWITKSPLTKIQRHDDKLKLYLMRLLKIFPKNCQI